MSGLGNQMDDLPNPYETKVYRNAGNPPLIAMLGGDAKLILDIGCGAGDNAALLHSVRREARVFGITLSPDEAQLAQAHMEHCWVADAEREIPFDLEGMQFDALVFSHVLEHMRDPATVLARYIPLLRPGGEILIAVPNILSWRMRIQFLLGKFNYESAGVLDETHLRFFTYHSIDRFLFRNAPDINLVVKSASGSVPLWLLRRFIFPQSISNWLDRMGCRFFPNLFGGQVMIKAIKKNVVS